VNTGWSAPSIDPPSRGSRPPTALIWVTVTAAPGLLGAVVSTAIWGLEPAHRYLVLTTPLAVAVLVTGLVGSAALGMVAAGLARSRRRAADAQREQAEQAERVAREVHTERMRLLLRLDHELKNPLQALRLALATARDDPTTALPAVEAQAARIGALLGDLRKLAELERRPLDLGPVDLAALLTEIRDDLSAGPDGAHRRWSVTLPTAPWPVPVLTADPDLVYLAVRNLATNALTYTRPGDSIDLRVIEPADGWVLIEVADTGLGVPDGEQDLVWEELARASSVRAIPGTGIGLPLVRTVARRHGGTATLRSREGTGTVVGIRLPVVPPTM
jgi:two-component system, OmpR family, sensor kinase